MMACGLFCWSPGSQHTLAMEIEDIGGGEVQSRFCIDGELERTFIDTYTLYNNTDYGLFVADLGTPTGVVVGKFDDFCADVST